MRELLYRINDRLVMWSCQHIEFMNIVYLYVGVTTLVFIGIIIGIIIGDRLRKSRAPYDQMKAEFWKEEAGKLEQYRTAGGRKEYYKEKCDKLETENRTLKAFFNKIVELSLHHGR